SATPWRARRSTQGGCLPGPPGRLECALRPVRPLTGILHPVPVSEVWLMAAREGRGWAAWALGSALVLVGVMGLSAPAQDPAQGPLPIPSRAKLEGAVEAVRKQYQDDYAAATSTKAKRALARKLMEGADEQKSPERVYAALDEARRLAAESGDATTALSA